MTGTGEERRRWLTVVTFAIGMAWVESASVYYLRALVGRIEPHQENPLPFVGVLGSVELVREAATLVMLLTLGMLAAHTWHRRLAYSAIAFGVWDIFYYLFLRVMTGWPRSIMDWDILFLLPLPWWGPVLSPVSIAILMIVWGPLATQSDDRRFVSSPARLSWVVAGAGIALALYVFMADAIRAISLGLDVTTQMPGPFNWPLFWVAFVLMLAPVAEIGWRMRQEQRPFSSTT